MQRKLTIGLLIFFVGVLITACGSKKSSSVAPAPTNANGGVGIVNPPTTNCANGCSQQGTFFVSDLNLFLTHFNIPGAVLANGGIPYNPQYYQAQQPLYVPNQPLNVGGYFGSLIGGVIGTAADMFSGAVQACAAPAIYGGIANAIGGDSSDINVGCGFNGSAGSVPQSGGAVLANGNGVAVSQMPVNVQYNYVNGVLGSLSVSFNYNGQFYTEEVYPENGDTTNLIVQPRFVNGFTVRNFRLRVAPGENQYRVEKPTLSGGPALVGVIR